MMDTAKNIILSKVNKKNFSFTNRCNSSIKHAYELCVKLNPFCKRILVQKEGGWLTYDKYGDDMGFLVDYVNTNDSVVDLLDLQEKLMSHKYLFFIFNRVPGYYCKNDSDEINNICHAYGVLTIEDVCGELAATNSDFVVGSFGRWKPINLGHGGFIASDNELGTIECKYPELENEVLPFLEGYDKRVEKLKKIVTKVKKELIELKLNVLHPECTELNVIVWFRNEDEKNKIIKYCEENKYEFEECPRDIRVNKNAISIEIKRIETKQL